METLVRVDYIPLTIIWSGEVKAISERLSELENEPDVEEWSVEYLTKDGKLTGAIITYFIKHEEVGAYV